MNKLCLIRHSLTEANERHLYGGKTDIPLSESGVEIARQRRGMMPLCDLYISSGMLRANQTLMLLTGRSPDFVLKGLREMDFGQFEMKSYDELKNLPEYIRWIEDETGTVRCSDGESTRQFSARVLAEGDRLLSFPAPTALCVCHGGVIVQLMQKWFPDEDRHFYEWQPGACGGYLIDVEAGVPIRFKETLIK